MVMENIFYIRNVQPDSIYDVIEEIGFDSCYIDNVVNKYDFKLIKIHNLSSPQAIIIKQIALSCGADAAVHREVIVCKIDNSDILLGCTKSQLKNIINKLSHQPFGLNKLSKQLELFLGQNMQNSLRIRNKSFNWGERTYIMGVLNITPDSFSDGGKYLSEEDAFLHAMRLIDEGADVIDIGGESTRPFSNEVSPEIELERVVPVINKIRENNRDIVISIDTRHSVVAAEAIKAGADIINDISALTFDSDMISVAKELNVPIILMHSLATPDKMQLNPEYSGNIVDEIFKYLFDRVQMVLNAGIKQENIIIDPGVGFGKTIEHNFEIINRINEFKSLPYPLLVGISRKSFLSKTLNLPLNELEQANLAVNSYLCSRGVDIIRVHDVKQHHSAITMLDNILKKHG